VNRLTLAEHLSYDQAKIVLESEEGNDGKKSLHLNGICIQGDIRNANQRVYSSQEIGKAVKTLNEQIAGGYSVLGEVDGSGNVRDFEIITVDVVAQPSAPGAYPTPVYEHLMNNTGGYKAFQVAQQVQGDPKAQKYIAESLKKIISRLN